MTVDPNGDVDVPELWANNLEDAAKDLAPHKSLDRIETSARFVLGTVAVVGAALTGVGVLASDVVQAHPWAALPSVILTIAALSLAAWALVGIGDNVVVDDLEEVETFYAHEVTMRGRLVRLAGITFAIALGLAIIPAFVTSLEHKRNPGETMTAVLSGAHPARLLVSIEGLPNDDHGSLEVTVAAGHQNVATGVWALPETTTFKLRTPVTIPSAAKTVEITATLIGNGERKRLAALTLPRAD